MRIMHVTNAIRRDINITNSEMLCRKAHLHMRQHQNSTNSMRNMHVTNAVRRDINITNSAMFRHKADLHMGQQFI